MAGRLFTGFGAPDSLNRLEARRRPSTRSIRRAASLAVEALESRRLLATITVTSALDGAPAVDGVVTLREAIIAANTNTAGFDANAGAAFPVIDRIEFAIPGTGVHTIQPTSALPTITEGVVIDGYTQGVATENTLAAGDDAVLLVELDGTSAGAVDGLTISGGKTTIRGLIINRFAGNGIHLSPGAGNTGNVIEGNFIGTNAAGTADLGNAMNGIFIQGTAGNTVGGLSDAMKNIVSGNNTNGVFISGASATSNNVYTNIIGADATTAADLGNSGNGVYVLNASNNIIGAPGGTNVISGNDANGVKIEGATATGNTVDSNFIGTEYGGLTDVGNSNDGVLITGAPNNLIGFYGNNICGNDNNGVEITGAAATGNKLHDNFIGISSLGTSALANTANGVAIIDAPNNTIGGTLGEFNLISGNGADGVLIQNAGSTGNVVRFNFIGIDINGTGDVGNVKNGVHILDAANNTIGGITVDARNIISGNDERGVRIDGITSTGNKVQGNYIGTEWNATAALGNSFDGVLIEGAPGNTIGGAVAGARNIVSGNGFSGIKIEQIAATGNAIEGNYVGTDFSGTVDVGNSQIGVYISGAVGNTVGGTTIGAGNLVSGNNTGGVSIIGLNASNNKILGNLIGTNAAGTGALGNSLSGVSLFAPNNIVGGTTAGARNVISANQVDGVLIFNSNATGNSVVGNFIGTDITGTAALGNFFGVTIMDASGNTVGDTAAGAGNLISGNIRDGVQITGLTSTGNKVLGNYIGTDVTGSVGLGNGFAGVFIEGAPNNIVGGVATAAANVLSDNAYGVAIQGADSTGNTVLGNFIGTNAAGTADLGNVLDGVLIYNGAAGNTVGGAARNIISGNNSDGIEITDNTVIGNTVQGNYIGTDVTGTLVLGNGESGVRMLSANNTIGGTAAAARNVISGNIDNGVLVSGAAATGNVILGNFIGTNVTGTAEVGNHDGVRIDNASGNTVGGSAAGTRNLISGNGSGGVVIVSAGATGNTILGNYIGTDVTGTLALGNSSVGVTIESGANNTIGGIIAGARNLISGNHSNGVTISSATGTKVLGNYIGADVSGTADLGNGAYGVLISDAPNNTIGGAAAGAGNIISGNGRSGILLQGGSSFNDLVQGNYIGINPAGANLGNDLDGVTIAGSSVGNTIGGLATGEGNAIWFNHASGVAVIGSGSVANRILSNSIFANALLGIDLGSDGVTTNDGGDGDSGPNSLQNAPELTSAVAGPFTTSVVGTFNSRANTSFDLQFFVSPQADASGHGEGKTFIITVPISTNASGNYTIAVDLPLVVTNGYFISATVSDNTSAETSEFSNAQVVVGQPPTVSISDASVNEGNAGPTNLVFTVTLSAAYALPVLVTYTTTDSTATAASGDYITQASVVTFLPGQTSKTIAIAINGDTTVEPNETFAVNLTGATNAYLDDPQGVGTIVNDDAILPPQISISDVSQNEGHAGTTGFTFTVTRSGDTLAAFNLYWSTANGSASSGTDYTAVPSTLLHFNSGDLSKTITVQVKGDTTVETNETFFVNLTGSGVTITDNQGLGTIVNDDSAVPPPPPPMVTVISDPCYAGYTALKVNDGNTGDKIELIYAGAQGKVQVKINNVSQGTFNFTGSVIVCGNGGDDTILVDTRINRYADLFGGDGNDCIVAGGCNTVISGGDGNDSLTGSDYADIIIGGRGCDILDAKSNDDILIAGRTSFDDDLSSLCCLQKEWFRYDISFASKLNHIRSGGGYNGSIKLTASTVFDDGVVDILKGRAGTDAFFANTDTGVKDTLYDKVSGETVIDIN